MVTEKRCGEFRIYCGDYSLKFNVLELPKLTYSVVSSLTLNRRIFR